MTGELRIDRVHRPTRPGSQPRGRWSRVRAAHRLLPDSSGTPHAKVFARSRPSSRSLYRTCSSKPITACPSFAATDPSQRGSTVLPSALVTATGSSAIVTERLVQYRSTLKRLPSARAVRSMPAARPRSYTRCSISCRRATAWCCCSSYVEGRSVAEAAQLTGWSKTMVHVQTFRAKRKLQTLLAQRGVEHIDEATELIDQLEQENE